MTRLRTLISPRRCLYCIILLQPLLYVLNWLLASLLDLTYAAVTSCFDLRTVSFKQQPIMKTSSFITLLALTFLSLLAAPSNAKGMGKGMGNSKGSPSKPSPSPPPPAPRFQTCPETCASIVQKSFFPCTFNNCIANFECQNLPNVAGFKNQQQCIQYCVSNFALSCPQGFTTTSTPTSRCLAARCT
jgi:hypothetical protein